MKVKANKIEIALDHKSIDHKAIKEKQIEKQKLEYPDLMMECLSGATKFDYVLVIEDGLFSVVKNSKCYQPEYTFGPTYTEKSYDTLYNLRYELQVDMDEAIEMQKREEVKAKAMAKLTPEEKVLLGL
jgi:hypothetical protein